MSLDIYWHVYLVNHWRDIVWEQLRILRETGLLKYAAHIYVSVIDPDGAFPEFASLVMDERKVILVAASNNPEDYEFLTLQKIHRDSIGNATSDLVLYMHTKGVSYPDDRHKDWRNVCHQLLKNWRHLIKQLYYCKAVGINYLPHVVDRWQAHFSGNFWMAKRDYIATLAYPKHSKDRFEAEWWICSGSPKVYSLPFVEHGSYCLTNP